MAVQLELIEHAELLEGLMALTDNNIGLSHQILQKVIKRTEYEVRETLREIAENIDVETRRARRRSLYRINRNMHLSSHHPKKPANTSAHHIAAWGDPRARIALEILVKWGIDINDEVNAVYLPCFETHTPHADMPGAIAHSQTHTDGYYGNVNEMLVDVDVPGATRDDIIGALREIAEDLQNGAFPI